MRLWGLLSLVVLSSSSLGSCTSTDPAPVYLDMDYQARCFDCGGADNVPRHVKALDGEQGLSIECSVSERAGKKLLSFSVLSRDAKNSSNTYSFKMSQTRLDAKDPGADCKVSIEEGDTSYGGLCTGDAPTKDAPCEVHLDTDGDIVNGTVYCKHMPAQGNMQVWRYVVDPFSESDPAMFQLRNCPGI